MNRMPLVLIVLATAALAQTAPDDDYRARQAHSSLDPSKRSLVFEVPHTIADVKVPGELEALGAPVQLKAYLSTDSLRELVEYFQHTFQRAGLFLPPPDMISDPGWGPVVVGYDIASRISYTVLFQDNGDNTTTAILGKAFLSERRDTSKDAAIAPVFPNAKSFFQSDLEAAKTMSYVVKAPPKEVLEFYRSVLGRTGYREASPAVFENGDDTLNVQVTPGKGGGSRVLVLKQPLAQPTAAGQARAEAP